MLCGNCDPVIRGWTAVTLRNRRFPIQNWSGARDLNPGPHGPEIYVVSSTETAFEGFELDWQHRPCNWLGLELSDGPGLLHELLHRPRPDWPSYNSLWVQAISRYHGRSLDRKPTSSPPNVTRQ